jgi:tRNA(fMet)-specific endonuclease VapC
VRYLIDTSILIPLRDSDREIADFVESLGDDIFASIVSQVELEGGVYRHPIHTLNRRRNLDKMMMGIQLLSFSKADAKAYGQIVAAAGYSRRKILDLMIAAQALVAEATLVTLNPQDFTDIPDLKVRTL